MTFTTGRVLRGGLFERVSTEEQSRYGYSIQNQVEELEKYCKDNKIKIVDHYCDEGVSGGKPYQKRPEMKRLLDDVQAGKIDIILFTRLDRWFRNVKEYFKVQEILDQHKVEWKAIWEDYDTTTSNGRMAITIFLAIAQNEREKTAERIKSVFDSKRRRKESFFGANSTPFGYIEELDENGVRRLVKDPLLKDALEDFWQIAVKYQNINEAARQMVREYGLTKSKHKWFELAKKEIYSGYYKGVEDYCPAYVSRQDWLNLQNRGPIRKTQRNRTYMFTGMIKCPECDRFLSSKYKTYKSRKDGSITEYFEYRCSNAEIRLCPMKRQISQSKTEKWLLAHLEELLQLEIERVEVLRAQPKRKPDANIVALKEKLRRLDVTYMAGNKTDEEYLSEQSDLKAAIRKAEKENPETDADKDLTLLKHTLEHDFRTIYKTLDDEDKRAFWRNLIAEIHIEGNTVAKVVFN